MNPQVRGLSAEMLAKRLHPLAVDSGSWGVVENMQVTAATAERPSTVLPTPVVVGHRGAPSYRPEHTIASYELAIDLGAEAIEPDVVVSRDGVLIARHENELSRTTDVASRPEFAHRHTSRTVDGRACSGWFVEDFTLAELRTLRAVERTPALRPLNTPYDGRFGILTLAEVVELARSRSVPGRPIRVLAELKHPDWFASVGLPVAELVAAELRRLDAARPDGTVIVQTFDAAALRTLREELGEEAPRMMQLVSDAPEFDPMLTNAGLREISTYAQGLAPSKHRILLRDDGDALSGVSDLVHRAHDAGLAVIPWTLRAENTYLPAHLRSGSDAAAPGDMAAEARLLLGLGVDGLITDSPEIAVRTRAELVTA